MKFEIFQDKNQQYYFRLKARNGKVILASSVYNNTVNAKIEIKSIIGVVNDADIFHKQVSTNKKHYFTLKSRQGEVLARSQLYKTRQGMERGISAVRRITAATVIKELA